MKTYKKTKRALGNLITSQMLWAQLVGVLGACMGLTWGSLTLATYGEV